jgi:hypothetical protein
MSILPIPLSYVRHKTEMNTMTGTLLKDGFSAMRKEYRQKMDHKLNHFFPLGESCEWIDRIVLSSGRMR